MVTGNEKMNTILIKYKNPNCFLIFLTIFFVCGMPLSADVFEDKSGSNLTETQFPWFMGSLVSFLCVLVLVTVLFVKSRLSGKQLEVLVKKQTQELALQTATLTTLFDSIPDLIFTKNLKLHFLHCNKAFLEHFNKNIDDIVGKSDDDGLGVSVDRRLHAQH